MVFFFLLFIHCVLFSFNVLVVTLSILQLSQKLFSKHVNNKIKRLDRQYILVVNLMCSGNSLWFATYQSWNLQLAMYRFFHIWKIKLKIILTLVLL